MQNTKENKTTVISKKLYDGTIVETILDNTKSKFVVSTNGKSSLSDQAKISDKEILIPPSISNPMISSGLIKFPSKSCEYQSIDKLFKLIDSFINKYVDVSDQFRLICVYYVLLTWVYDDFEEIPYLRKLGNFGTGKTRFLKVLGSICYKATFVSGGTSTAAVFHLIDKFSGTLILDEADFNFSDEKSDIAKILNNGNAKGFPILRVSQGQDKKFRPVFYNVYCPKIIVSRNPYFDKALESRFITESYKAPTLRNDIPTTLPDTFEGEALEIRNKLLCFRLQNLGKIKLFDYSSDSTLEARIKQIYLPLLSLTYSKSHRNMILNAATDASTDLKIERSNNIEAQVLSVIKSLKETGKPLSIKEITNLFFLEYADHYDRKITTKWIGYIIRKKLNLPTRKSNGNFIIDENNSAKLEFLYDRYSV